MTTVPPTSSAVRPLLLLLLDGVAYERMRTLHDAGHFRRFGRPARLVSVFPTLTDPAYDVLFGTGPTPGYEAGWFDRRRNRLTPAFLNYLRGANEAWVRHVDYRLSFLGDAVMYLFPRWVYRSELQRARRVFQRCWRCGRRQVALYILSTDGLCHMLPPAQIDAHLIQLEGWLDTLARGCGTSLDIVLMSDHGLSTLPAGQTHQRRFALPDVLRSAGLRITRRLRAPGDVVLPLLGLLDVARLFAYDADTRTRVVEAVRACPQVELVAARDGECADVFAGDERGNIYYRARIDQAPAQFGYRAVRGDPLRLAGACASMRAAGMLDADGFATVQDWLEATAEASFPAAPQRLWEGLFSLCEEQPDVVVSLKNGWYVGSGLLSRFVRMQGTHGGLHRRATDTFVMTTRGNLPSLMDLRAVGEFLRRELGWSPGPPGRLCGPRNRPRGWSDAPKTG